MFIVEYTVNGQRHQSDASMVRPVLPVRTRRGGMRYLPWGEGEPFEGSDPGDFQGWPAGKFVTLEEIKHPTGYWQTWRNKTYPVKICVSGFLYEVPGGEPQSHNLVMGQYLQGALLCKPLFDRVYVVTMPGPIVGVGWPRIVGTSAVLDLMQKRNES